MSPSTRTSWWRLCAMHRTAGNHHPIDERVDFFFEVSSWRGEPRLVEEDKAAELRWFALGRAAGTRSCRTSSSCSTGSATGCLDPVVTFGF